MKARVFVLGLVLLAGVAGACLAADPIGLVVSVEGKATAVGQDGKSRALRVRSDIYLNDAIRTAKDSKIQIMFEDNTVFAQGEESEIVIDEYVYSPEKKEDNSFLARVGRGVYRIITGKITEMNPDRFKVKTGRATIGIRGCETGIDSGDLSDLIMALDLAPGDTVFVLADASGASRLLDQSGLGVMIDNMGRFSAFELDLDRIRSILFRTNPGILLAGAGQAPWGSGPAGGQPSGEPSGAGPAPGGAGASTWPSGDTQAGGGLSDAYDNVLEDPLISPDGEELLGGGVVPDATLPELNLGLDTSDPVDPNVAFDVTLALTPTIPEDSSTVLESGGGTTTPTGGGGVEPPPENNTAGLVLSGGGAGAVYAGTFPAVRDVAESWGYHRIEGAFGLNSFDGHASGARFDNAGNVLNPVDIPLSVPLAQFGPPDIYIGSLETDIGGGVLVRNDNLQQFVTIESPADDRTLLYFGYESRSYANSRLDPNFVHTYDVKLLEHPAHWSAPTDPTTPQDVQLFLNPQTGTFYIPGGPNNLAIVSRADHLTFYGQESQGIGAVHEQNGPMGNSLYSVGALAGFRVPGAPLPRESGQETHRGYAIAIAWPDPAMVGEPKRLYNSVNFASDTVADNEGQVVVAIDKDSPDASIDMRVNAYQDGSSPQATDIHLNDPDDGGYVMNDTATGAEIYGANYGGINEHFEVITMGGGADWNYGKWMGEREVDYGTGAQVEHVEGEYVEGNTLDGSTFADLVAGAVAYNLASPSPGWAEADVGNGTFAAHLDGDCNMYVNIPGGGAQPIWGGTFNLSGGGGETLSLVTGNQNINPVSGHLELSSAVSSFGLSADGNGYSAGDLAESDMSGNLVGPGLPTGIIGDGRFEMNDGMEVNLLFGSDLE